MMPIINYYIHNHKIARGYFILIDCTVKRKRGRPKGSTKKVHTEDTLLGTSPNAKPNHRPEVQAQATEELQDESSDALDCKKCKRKFCNRRQIMKHICFIGLKEEGDEEEDNGIMGCTVYLMSYVISGLFNVEVELSLMSMMSES